MEVGTLEQWKLGHRRNGIWIFVQWKLGHWSTGSSDTRAIDVGTLEGGGS